MARMGTKVLEFTRIAVVSKRIGFPLTYIISSSIVSLIFISPFLANTVRVSDSQSITEPSFSNTALIGTSVLPFIMTDSASVFNSSPSTYTLTLLLLCAHAIDETRMRMLTRSISTLNTVILFILSSF